MSGEPADSIHLIAEGAGNEAGHNGQVALVAGPVAVWCLCEDVGRTGGGW